MTYIALLRGINVGGKNRVDMKQLKAALEKAGLENVATYINSGNVLFDSDLTNYKANELVERTIEKTFNFPVNVITIDKDRLTTIAQAIPADWVNDGKTMKCDVLFLHEDIDSETIFDDLKLRPEIDRVKYVPGAVIWSVDRQNVTKSGLPKIIGTYVYGRLTIRNCNTTRKLLELVKAR